MAAFSAVSLSAASLDSWTQYSGTPIADLNTDHPTIGDGTAGSANSHTLYSVAPTYTLENVGDSLTLSANALFSDVNAAQADQFRFGIYDSNGTTPGTGAANVSGWLGYFATNAGTGGTGDQRSRLWKRLEGNNSSFGSSGGPVGTVPQIGWAGATGNTLLSGNYSFSMVLTRTTDGLDIVWTITGLDEGSTYAITGNYSDTAANTYTFDRVGLFVGGGVNASELALSNLDLTFTPAIPEPATTALLFGLAIGGVALLRRRAA